jgi:type I restriction enzyme S subunit
MGHIKREHLKRALCAIPGERLIGKAGNSLSNIIEKQIELRLESTTLSTLRDTLLPKLLSGELFISEGEPELAGSEEATSV